MKMLVVSDNHGDRQILLDIVNRFSDSVDLLVHCGDSELSPTIQPMPIFNTVKGNNDYGLDYPSQLIFPQGNEQILVVHGDQDGVNYSLTPLLLKGQANQATIVCYGHTHQLAVSEDAGILFLNPGSISLPRGEYASIGGTFAIIDDDSNRWQVDYYNRNLQLIPELHFEFPRP